jgi:hypothetical protein
MHVLTQGPGTLNKALLSLQMQLLLLRSRKQECCLSRLGTTQRACCTDSPSRVPEQHTGPTCCSSSGCAKACVSRAGGLPHWELYTFGCEVDLARACCSDGIVMSGHLCRRRLSCRSCRCCC